MKINFIFSAVKNHEKLLMGDNNKLLISLKKDMEFFKNITIKNVILMGFNTWKSINYRYLPDRINLILTNKTEFLSDFNTVSKAIRNYQKEHHKTISFFINYKIFGQLVSSLNDEIFVIGGAQTIKSIIDDKKIEKYLNRIYLTEILNVVLDLDSVPDTYLTQNILDNFNLISQSEVYEEEGIRFIFYSYKH